jgi:hypothetical protein
MRDVGAVLGTLPAVFDLGDASSAGVTARVLERAVRGGLVHRLSRGLFTPTAVWRAADATQRHLLLATAAARRFPALTLSHHTAALVHGLPSPLQLPGWVALTSDRSDNTCPTGRLARLEPALLPAAHVQPWRGMRVTIPDRTVVDCLRRLPLPDAVAIGDAALRRRLTTRERLLSLRRAQAGWPGVRTVDIGTGLLDDARETWFESWSFTILWQLGIEVPAAQVAVYDARGRFVGRVDGLWREGGTVVEADGAGKYLGEFDPDGPSGLAAARAVVAEKVREDRLRSCGLEVVRYDVPEMRWRPQNVAARVHDARGRGDLGRFTGRLVPSPWSRVPLVHPVPRAAGALVAPKRPHPAR